MGDELWRRGALELAGMIAAREVSSVEVVSAHLQRIDEVNPALNAIVRRLDVEALVFAPGAVSYRGPGVGADGQLDADAVGGVR